ncbi:hypothetical protein CYY_003165 [Polysphondylium violaceum]|uniref:FNIP repeat-containing protein n=1 Tax=Polysphondylium violaceum TaxID=133409 RepID=A0A8J4V8Y9_9MYCE|nr:hypothetical protein CYY_003165 [Polysphondylium violaceum]
MSDQDLFFTIWRNSYLQQKVFISYTDYIIIKNITQLDKKHNHLLSLNQHNIPVVYHLKDLDHYFIYCSHVYYYLITHVIVSTYFYVNHFHLLQQQHTTPILFGISITDKFKDPILLANDLPQSIKYYKQRNCDMINKDFIPKSVTSVYLDTTLIDIGAIPNSVRILVLNNQREDEDDSVDSDGSDIEYYIDDKEELKEDFNIKCLPQSLTQFNFNYDCKSAYINLDEIPPNLLYLNLNECKCVINGKESVTQLKFESFYPLENFNLPSNLTYLSYEYWGDSYSAINLPFLPRNLKTLILKCCLTSESKDNFPIGLINYINKDRRINQEKVLIIPHSVKKLGFYNQLTFSELPVIPITVTDLEISRSWNLFTLQIKHLTNITKLNICFDRYDDELLDELLIGLIPSTVTDLELNYSKPIKKGVIPNSVTKLFLSSHKTVPIYIPNSVTTLTFLVDNQIYPEIEIPSSVRTLGAYGANFEKFPFHLFPNVTTFWFSKSDPYNLNNN